MTKPKANSTSRGPRVVRPPFPIRELQLLGTIPVADIPNTVHTRNRSGKRRWEELGEQIRAASIHGEAFVISVPPGLDSDVVRSGLASELERFGLRCQVSTARQDDGSAVLYCQVTPKMNDKQQRE